MYNEIRITSGKSQPSSGGWNQSLETLIQTTEPYEPRWTTVNRRRNPTRPRTKRAFGQLASLDELFSEEQHFEKYYNLRFPEFIINRDINTEKDHFNELGK